MKQNEKRQQTIELLRHYKSRQQTIELMKADLHTLELMDGQTQLAVDYARPTMPNFIYFYISFVFNGLRRLRGGVYTISTPFSQFG